MTSPIPSTHKGQNFSRTSKFFFPIAKWQTFYSKLDKCSHLRSSSGVCLATTKAEFIYNPGVGVRITLEIKPDRTGTRKLGLLHFLPIQLTQNLSIQIPIHV